MIEANDPIWDELTAVAQAAKARPAAWLEQRNIYGDLVAAEQFSDAFSKWLSMIWTQGCEAALVAYAQAARKDAAAGPAR